jgi:Family of unknown function (DUF5985)
VPTREARYGSYSGVRSASICALLPAHRRSAVLAFGVGFVLLALNQARALWLGDADERVGYTHLLRILGFVLILAAIIDKNISRRLSER